MSDDRVSQLGTILAFEERHQTDGIGMIIESFVAHSAKVNCVSIGRRSGRWLATGGDDRKVNIWQVGKPNAIAVSKISPPSLPLTQLTEF